MKLYLVQHGDAVSKEVDPDRPLSEKGVRDVQNMAGFLTRANVRAPKMMHSGKTRAEQTASILARAVMPAVEVEQLSGIAPMDDVIAFAHTLDSWQQDTFVVGHLPFMPSLVAYLLDGDPEKALLSYHPGSVVCLQRAESGSWQLNWMLRPELLHTS